MLAERLTKEERAFLEAVARKLEAERLTRERFPEPSALEAERLRKLDVIREAR